MDDKLKKLIYRSLDGDLPPREQKRLDKALRRAPGLREEKTRILKIRRALAESRAPGFSPGFAGRVIRRIAKEEKSGMETDIFYETFLALFRRVALIGGAALLALLTYNLSIGDKFSEEEALFASDTTCRELQRLPLFWDGGGNER
jgi:anti-sigma factor RsiW